MTLIVENGTGVIGANSFVSTAFVTTYLTDRNRVTENTWSTAGATAQDAACIAATDHIENASRNRFKGNKQYSDLSVARSTLDVPATPLAAEIVTVGSQVYTFVATLGSAGDVLIGANASESIDNLVDAINANPSTAGTAFHSSTVVNADAAAQTFTDDTMLAFALVSGTPGNGIVTTTNVTGASWNFATLNGGSDIVRPQPLSFPRISLQDRDGIAIIGMPERLKFATAEYAVRSRLKILAPDPTRDALGGNVIRLSKKVGPISKDITYQSGTANSGTLPSYPAADRLLTEYLSAQGVIR